MVGLVLLNTKTSYYYFSHSNVILFVSIRLFLTQDCNHIFLFIFGSGKRKKKQIGEKIKRKKITNRMEIKII